MCYSLVMIAMHVFTTYPICSYKHVAGYIQLSAMIAIIRTKLHSVCTMIIKFHYLFLTFKPYLFIILCMLTIATIYGHNSACVYAYLCMHNYHKFVCHNSHTPYKSYSLLLIFQNFIIISLLSSNTCSYIPYRHIASYK